MTEFARVIDLLAPDDGRDYEIELPTGERKKIKLRVLSFGDIVDCDTMVESQPDTNEHNRAARMQIAVIHKSLMEPKMNIEEVRNLHNHVRVQILAILEDTSGLGKK